MTLYEFPNMTQGADTFLVSLSTQIPILPVFVLLFVFCFVALTGIMIQLRRNGYADFPLWFLTGFLTLDLLGAIMSLVSGILSPYVLGTVVALTLLCSIWYFLSRGRFEQ